MDLDRRYRNADWALAFDHAYNVIESPEPFSSLSQRGFAKNPREVEHEGAVLCRFIVFPAAGDERIQYLEFCELRDPAKLLALREHELGRAVDPAELVRPGLSLHSRSPLRQIFEALAPQLAEYEPRFQHKSRSWQTDPAGPGWNYLKFQRSLLDGVELWLTEYEKDEAGEKERGPLEIPPHPNTAEKIVGAVVHATDAELAGLTRLLGVHPAAGRPMELCAGARIWSLSDERDSELELELADKRTPLRAIVVACASLDRFWEVARPDYSVRWNGADAAGIRLGPSGWDILAIEKTG